MMKPDKKQISELERQLADSWRTAKNLKQNYDNMTEREIMEELSDLKVDVVLDDGTIAEMIQE